MSNAINPAAAIAAPANTTKTAQSSTSDGFSSAFSGALQTAQHENNTDSADTSDKSNEHTTSSEMSATAVVLLGPDGNPLPGLQPQVAWSGTVAAGDNQGATALALAGDATTMAMTAPVNATDISTAVQNALRQPLNASTTLPTAVSGDGNASISPVANRADNVLSAALAGQNNPVDFLSTSTNALNPNDAMLKSMLSGVDAKSDFTSVMNQLGSNTATPVATTAIATTLAPTQTYLQTARTDQPTGNLPLPITHSNWGEQLGEGVRWMVGQHMQQADLRLNPPALGLLEVRIQMNSSDHASLTFCSPHSAVRDAIEHALPRLRDMMSESGVQLGDVNVSQQSLSHHHANPERFMQQHQSGGDGRGTRSETAEMDALPPVQLPRIGTGLIDTYA